VKPDPSLLVCVDACHQAGDPLVENIPWPNWGRVNDTELVETFEAGMTSLDTEVAAMYFKEVQKIIVEKGYWNPLYYDTNVKLSHKTVKGLKHPPVGEGWIFLDVEVTD